MNLKNMKIGMRLGAGIGLVMLLMVTLIVVAQIRLASIGDIIDRIIGEQKGVESYVSGVTSHKWRRTHRESPTVN